MPKTFPIRLEVEEFALGAVLRKLHEMQGIAKLDLNLGQGGAKPAAKSLTERGDKQNEVLAALARGGQLSIEELMDATGMPKKPIYSAVHNLKNKRLVKNTDKGVYALTDKAKRELNVPQPKALPPPKKKKETRSARALPGAGRAALIAVLSKTPGLRTSQIAEALSHNGMSAKSVSGVMDRARTDGMIKKNGNGGYVLTAKGDTEVEAAHG